MPQPNILIIMADDLGYGDLSCFGCTDFDTPSLDRIAAGGVKLTQWYATSPVCSPSRAGLLSGQHPSRVNVPGNVRPGNEALMPSTPTIPRLLKDGGYNTFLAGKWHLGTGNSQPHCHGFDHWFGFLHGCIDYYSHTCYWPLCSGDQARHDLWQDGDEKYRNGKYFTDLMTEHAIKYLREAADHEAPFYLHVAYNNPHYPMQAPNHVLERFAHLPEGRRLMAAMVTAMDDAIGRLLDELDALGIADDTFVIFQPDHGPSVEPRNWTDGRDDPFDGGDTGGLRGHKFLTYEGGIRVPTVARFPGVIPAGSTVDGVGVGYDWLPTVLSAVGGDTSNLQLDGHNVLPMLRGEAPSPHDSDCWLHGGGDPAGPAAIRAGDDKLVRGYDGVELFDLADDPAESTNLADQCPDRAAELTKQLDHWLATLPPHN